MSHRPKAKQLPPLTLGVVRKIKEVTGLDLLRASDPEVVAQLWTDPVLAGLVIATAGGPEDLEGDELAEAQNALYEALIEFFPKRSIYDDFIEENQKSTPGEVDPWRIVFRAAGCAGLPPWDYSFRQLIWMAQGAFEPTAAILAQQSNAHAKKPSEILDVDTINPWHPKRPRPKRTRAQNARTRKD